MKSIDKAFILIIISFFIILAMGIYMRATEYGSYELVFKGREGSSSGPINGNSLILVAVVFGALMSYIYVSSRSKK